MSLLGFWRRHYRDIPRIRQIIMVATRHGFGHLVEQLGLKRFVSLGRRAVSFRARSFSEQHTSAPVRLRLMFEELGPSFIKLGQVMACRPDLLPIEYALELNKLTDSVPPFPFSAAREIVERELGAPLTSIFATLNPEPIAAASIAQVHAALLLDNTEVMVKVQRPNIEQIIDRDISILRGIAELIEIYVPDMAIYNPRGIVEEFARTISRELDFYIEASNAGQLRQNFFDSDILYVPRVFPEFSSKHVLVLERITGLRIDDFERIDRAGFNRKEISRNGAAAFFQMVFQNGFFHADPHPGNIFLLADGKIGLVDFGIMGRVSEENMQYYADTIVALVEHDFDKLVQEYINMGFVPDDVVDMDRFQRELKEDLVELLEPYYGMKVKQIDFGMYVDRLTKISLRHGLVMPQNLYLVNKALVTLEGILRQLDPDFDFVEIAQPHVARLLLKRKDPLRMLHAARKSVADFSDVFTVFPKQLHRTFRQLLRGDIRVKVQHEELQHLIRDVDKASNRLSFSIITAAIIVASSIIIHAGQGQLLFGMPVFGLIGYFFAAVLGFWILIGILRSGQM